MRVVMNVLHSLLVLASRLKINMNSQLKDSSSAKSTVYQIYLYFFSFRPNTGLKEKKYR